ncbi:MAG TPA: methyltransferase domain-containing protein [Vicinamibacterales bacterium]|nr:methyltransferase domain-containing protein [Vicinamibacterales bacterium]
MPDTSGTDRPDERRRQERRKLEGADFRRINFGCGPFPLERWLKTDGGDGRIFEAPDDPRIVALDVWEFLGHVPSNAVEYITSEQFFEHFDRHEGHRLIREWYRVLKPGGVLRIQCPDLEKEIRIYLDMLDGVSWEDTVLPHRIRHIGQSSEPSAKLVEGERYTRAMLINNGMRLDGHKFIYDFETLAQSLSLAGFRQIVRERFGRSTHAPFQGIDRHDGGETGRHWIPGIVLTVEATK